MKTTTLLIFLMVFIGLAQTNGQSLTPSLENIAPPSPNASALGKFGNVPVGLSTGIPRVSIPIYSYENLSNGLNLSVSLDYHAGGIRVDEVASNVGLGWALSSGGVISRTLRGIYDEMPNIGFVNAPGLPVDEQAGNSPYTDLGSRPFNDMYAFELDSQNDVFTFNFNGRSGKFLYGKNNDFLMINSQKLKVEKIIGQVQGKTMISRFIITDENGYKYVFDDEEVTVNHSMATSASVYSSAWYLSKMYSPSGKDSITFIYENTDFTYSIGKSTQLAEYYPGMYPALPEKPEQSSTSSQRIFGKRIKYIYFPDGTNIAFEYAIAERIDLPGDHLLAKITISNGSSERGYSLVHDYSLNRATLKKVIPFYGSNEIAKPPYEFTYDATLPDRLSRQQDHWGFYNDNTGSLIPSELINAGGYKELGGGNRDTDPNRCKAGSLKRIKYPTGGYTEFEMEVNRAVDPRLNQRREITETREYREDEIAFSCNSQGSTVTDFQFEGDPSSLTEITIQVPSHHSCSGGTGCKIYMEVRDASGSLQEVFEVDAPSASYTVTHNLTTFNLVPGTYAITAYTQGLTNYYGYINFRWRETREDNPITYTTHIGHNQLYVGGLRVKSISDFDGISATPAKTKEYEYLMEDGTTSSGTLGFYPAYSYPVCYDSRANGVQNPGGSEVYLCNNPNFLVRSSSTIYPLTYINGSPVTYKRVVEKVKGNGGFLGKTVRYFTSFADVPVVTDNRFPFTPPEYKGWMYGLLEREMVYDKNGFKLEETVFNYSKSTDRYFQDPVRFENFRSVAIAPVKYLLDSQEGIPYWSIPVYFKARSFYPSGGRADVKSKINFQYDHNGGIVKTQHYYHYDPSNYYLKRDTLIDSKLQRQITSYIYPKDMVSRNRDPSGIYQGMVARNIINPVIETVRFEDNEMLFLSRTDYQNPGPGLYGPKTVVTKVANGPEQIRLRYSDYNSEGDLLSQSLEQGPPTSYLWGYNGEYPVVEVKNAGQSDIAYTGFESDGKGNWSYGGTVGSAAGYALTGGKYYAVSGGMDASGLSSSKRYTLSYWQKGGTVTVSGGTVGAAVVGRSHNGWTHIERTVTGTATVSLDGNGYIDEVRIHPEDALMTTYTYEPLVGITSQTGASGNTLYYEYDGFGRLEAVRDGDGKLLEGYDYHYKDQ